MLKRLALLACFAPLLAGCLLFSGRHWDEARRDGVTGFQYIGEIEVNSWGSPGVSDRAYIHVLSDGRVLATDPANKRIIVFDPQGNVFISDGYCNNRVVKYDKNGRFVKSVGGSTVRSLNVRLSLALAGFEKTFHSGDFKSSGSSASSSVP
jgi:hypothetical protein